ncbi:MAG: hypothetical protein MUF49_24875 [Oculatellaceae cyanobacterium Prado106]|nr:hypothetical protein [Oculatellaceae cyanobacterium Prado106]
MTNPQNANHSSSSSASWVSNAGAGVLVNAAANSPTETSQHSRQQFVPGATESSGTAIASTNLGLTADTIVNTSPDPPPSTNAADNPPNHSATFVQDISPILDPSTEAPPASFDRSLTGSNGTSTVSLISNLETSNLGTDNALISSSVTSSLSSDSSSGNGNTSISISMAVRLVRGTRGSDRLRGEDQNDDILGGDGDDHLMGRGGDDILRGGKGRDRLRGGTGTDTMIGGGNADVYVLSDAVDTMTQADRLKPIKSWDLIGDRAIAFIAARASI